MNQPWQFSVIFGGSSWLGEENRAWHSCTFYWITTEKWEGKFSSTTTGRCRKCLSQTSACFHPKGEDVYLSTFPSAPFLATLECGDCLWAELCSPVTSSAGLAVAPRRSQHAFQPRQKKHPSAVHSLKTIWGIATWPGARQSRTKIRYKIHTHTNQNYSGHEIMQTNLARNELQNTFIFSYSETLIKSQLLRSYSISGGITVFRTPLLMHTTSQSKRIRAQFPDANDLILSYLAVYI